MSIYGHFLKCETKICQISHTYQYIFLSTMQSNFVVGILCYRRFLQFDAIFQNRCGQMLQLEFFQITNYFNMNLGELVLIETHDIYIFIQKQITTQWLHTDHRIGLPINWILTARHRATGWVTPLKLDGSSKSFPSFFLYISDKSSRIGNLV